MRDRAAEIARTRRWLTLDPTLPGRVVALKRALEDRFGRAGAQPILTCAPGRAEILGCHTDYNQGFTLSANIGANLLALMRPRSDASCRVASLDLGGEVTFPATTPSVVRQHRISEADAWARYIQGVVWAFLDAGWESPGFDAVIQSSVPLSGGMSSSAALETAVARGVAGMVAIAPDAERQATLCKRGENDVVGAPCGYLDQGTVGLAEGWLFMDHRPAEGRDFSWQSIDADLEGSGYCLVVGFDPGSVHANTDGKYAERHRVCLESVPVLADLLERETINALRDVSVSDYDRVCDRFRMVAGPRAADFVAHVVAENDRVLSARTVLGAGDFEALGDLMTASGSSALDRYDLAEDAPELRFLYGTVVASAQRWGVAGVRNMGGGFNATSLLLVRRVALAALREELGAAYRHETGREYQTLTFAPAPSAGILDLATLDVAIPT